MTALLSCCESCNGTAGAKLSSLPKAGLIDSYRFNLCVFASGWLSVPGKLSRSAKRQANFSLPFFGSRDSSLIFTVGIPALWMISEPGEVSWIFISAPVCSLVLGLHGDLSPLWSAGLKIWCSGGKIKKKKKTKNLQQLWFLSQIKTASCGCYINVFCPACFKTVYACKRNHTQRAWKTSEEYPYLVWQVSLKNYKSCMESPVKYWRKKWLLF